MCLIDLCVKLQRLHAEVGSELPGSVHNTWTKSNVAAEWVGYRDSMALLAAGNVAEGDTIDDLTVGLHRKVRVEKSKNCAGEGVAVL